MALIRKIAPITTDVNTIHDPVDCTYSVFKDGNGKKFLQIDTYGSSKRKIKGKKGQSLQFNEKSLLD
ncbi:MAG: methionyl-tRNA formyltransferase [candidate division Zixibacteria bacterium]|nr:methionyl-tRNA formyltransferase [candidate division Zixibacteria bacterium]